jgi:hypothetical protein
MLSLTKSRLAGKTLLQTWFFFLLVTQICFAQWVPLGLEDKNIKDIAARNSTIFAVTTDSVVYRSTNNGITWLQIIDSGAIDIAIAPSGTVFMVKDSLVYSSLNNGDTWIRLNVVDLFPPPFFYPFYGPKNVAVNPLGIVFCGFVIGDVDDRGSAITISTDDGLSWTSPGDALYGGLLIDFRGQSVITIGWHTHGIGTGGYTYLSSDNGVSWSSVGPPTWDCKVLSFCLNGNILMGGNWLAASGLFLSSDSCNTWTQVSTLIPDAGLSIESGGVLVGNDSLGVFLFSDEGDSLGSRNEGLTNLNVQALTLDNNGYVYAGTGNGVWRRPLSEVTSVEEHSTTLPSSYFLSQNFPNPFNPSTIISYQLPISGNVILKVYDILGNEMATLVDEFKPAGKYETEFNAVSLPSGVYFYQLKAGEFITMKKMILLK